MKKAFLLIVSLLLMTSILSAAVYVNANDLEPAQITSELALEDGIKIVGADGKHVTIEAMTDPNEAPDGEIFNNRIKLEGSGNADQRVVKFPAVAGETLTLYSHSSGEDARTLALVNLATGEQVATIDAPAKADPVGISTVSIPADGEYAIYSTNKGINIYCLICE